MREMDRQQAIEPEDREIMEKLAKLQNMYNQIGGLRTLLPEKLINPTRFALENPHRYEPEKLAAYLQDAAQAGIRDVEKFKKDWHSDDVRELWQVVNTGDVPQGGDAWTLDYDTLILQNQGKNSTSLESRTLTHSLNGQTDAEIAKIVSDFQVKHPDLKISPAHEANPLPLDIGIGQVEFRIEKSRDASTGTFKATYKPGTEPFALRDRILESIKKSDVRSNLMALLEMIAAYHDIKTRPCDKCDILVNNKLQLPLIRQLKTAEDNERFEFLALHPECA
ncbi:hypothetical protein PV08_07550 [Exophiala spinifera]|uniref:Uncharacterized protein n=1 Tax=Exophiala spinifera TaxID=91928 RepID=A0A0D2B7V7_9EURO|nr:uncharacterized protein PV08_07550 [Exophiala spinifera]KIW14765.1 hypothetical protein PV08_07550 [Exophiala spinifera]